MSDAQPGDQVADTDGMAKWESFWIRATMAESDGRDVQDRVDRVIDDLTAGRVLRPQVERLDRAVTTAKRDQAVQGAIGRHHG